MTSQMDVKMGRQFKNTRAQKTYKRKEKRGGSLEAIPPMGFGGPHHPPPGGTDSRLPNVVSYLFLWWPLFKTMQGRQNNDLIMMDG